nr:MAE_28990/MAE_18760 family HEPN-like nuclease [uncultured Trichococcus sp.]
MKQDRSLYLEKKEELLFYIDSLMALYDMNDHTDSPYTFYLAEKIQTRKKYNLEDFLVILKSNSFIMMYNIIESTIKNTIDHMYNEINNKSMRYIDVCGEIRKIWFNYHFKENNNIVLDKFKGISQKIVDDIIAENKIILDFDKFKLSGNADLRKIKDIFSEHGVAIDASKTSSQGSSLITIKEKRNSLAHGNESFIESAKDFSEKDIQKFSNHVFSILEYIMDVVDNYIDNEKYRI